MRFSAVPTTGKADCEEFWNSTYNFINSEHALEFAELHFFAAAAAALIFGTHSLFYVVEKKMADSKQAFLSGKADNLREYIKSYSPDAEAQALMSTFNPVLILPTILTHLAPAAKAGALPGLVLQLMQHLTVPESESAAVRDKLLRYFQMFVEVATA